MILKDFLWETFQKTGSLEAYVFFKQIEEIKVTRQKDVEFTEELIVNSKYWHDEISQI